MTSKEYWEKRSEATLIANEKSILQYEKELKEAYEAAISKLKKEVEAFYARYSKENKLDLATVRQRLNASELKDFKTQAKIYLEEVDRLGLDPQYKQYLRQLSARAYVSKLQELETNIRHHLETLATGYEKGLGQQLKNGYEDSFYRTMFEVQKQAGFGVDFTALGDKQLQKAVGTKWLANNYSGRIWTNKTALRRQLEQLIPQEFVRGRGPKEVARDLAAKLNTSYSNAVRLARTEMNHISNQGTLEAYKKSGVVDEYQYLATLDNRTSDICRELDGKVFKLSEAQTGVNLPPMHPYCRSTTVPYYPEDELSEPSDRVARDAEGKTYLVGKDVTYEEWVNEHAEASYAKRVKANAENYADIDQPPISLQNYDEHARAWLEKEVLSRISEEDAQLIRDFIEKTIEDNDFCMRVSSKGLEFILKDGVFKNQMEVGKSRGLYNPGVRKQASKNLFGSDIDNMEDADYEKYGYLGTKNKAFDLKQSNVNQYGDIRVTFKKDSLKNRTTYTLTDSLGPAGVRGRQTLVAGKTSNPTANGIEYYELKRATEYISTNKTASTKNAQSVAYNLTRGYYFELQYHGSLTVNDIESVQMLKRDVTETIIDKLNEYGIPLEIIE